MIAEFCLPGKCNACMNLFDVVSLYPECPSCQSADVEVNLDVWPRAQVFRLAVALERHFVDLYPGKADPWAEDNVGESLNMIAAGAARAANGLTYVTKGNHRDAFVGAEALANALAERAQEASTYKTPVAVVGDADVREGVLRVMDGALGLFLKGI